MPKPVAAITGASSGIGAVFARKLAERNYDLLLIARRRDRLDQLARDLPGCHETMESDLSSSEGIQRAAARLAGEPRLSMLINNAGFGIKGRFFEAPLEDQQRMHRVHIDATLALTHSALVGMVQRDQGAIINVSSVAAYARSAGNVSYSATKSWINVFSEGIYLELKSVNSKVKVQALCPGFTYTEFHDVMSVDRRTVAKWLWMSADRVVDASLAGLESGKLFVVPGAIYKLFTALMPRIPTSLRLLISAASPQSRHRV